MVRRVVFISCAVVTSSQNHIPIIYPVFFRYFIKDKLNGGMGDFWLCSMHGRVAQQLIPELKDGAG